MPYLTIYTTTSDIESLAIQEKFIQSNIPFMVLNKMDTAHASIFGEIQIQVEQDHILKAKTILKDYLE